MRTPNKHKQRAISPGACCLVFLGAILAPPFPAAAAPITPRFHLRLVPRICGSVCMPAISESNDGGISSGVLSSVTSLDRWSCRGAYRSGHRRRRGRQTAAPLPFDASHFDTWFCPDPIACALLAMPGSFLPVIIDLHVSGSAS